MPTAKTTIAIIEDDPVSRELLAGILATSARYVHVGVFETAEEGIAKIPALAPDLVILDVRLPRMSGIEALVTLREKCPRTRFLMLTNDEGDGSLFAALEAGAAGFVLKSDSPTQILGAIEETMAGGAPLSRAAARRVVASFAKPALSGASDYNLTEREAEIIDSLARGFTYKEIAAKLGISTATVKNHLSRIYVKMGVRSRTEAVVKWLGK